VFIVEELEFFSSAKKQQLNNSPKELEQLIDDKN